MGRITIAFIALLTVANASASGTVAGRVVNVRIDNTGKGIVYFDQNVAGSPSCVMPTYENAMAFDTSTAAGKAIMARALAAKATGDVLKAQGTGTCTIYGNAWAEDVENFDYE